MDFLSLIISLVVFLYSVILHELAHGYAALRLGDTTAKYEGRLTLNPVPHIDPIGSVVLPLMLALSHAPFVFGWAKPVPYNPYNLKNQRWGEAIVAGAGPATNLLIAIILGLLIRFSIVDPSSALGDLVIVASYTNIVLGFFNLIPIPPIDGSKVLSSILPMSLRVQFKSFEMVANQFSFIALVVFMLFFFFVLQGPFYHLVSYIFSLIIGV